VSRVLVLAGGSPHAHDFQATGDALADLLETDGHAVARAAHPDDAAPTLAAGLVDVLVLDGLWWRMDGDAYDRWRPRWRYETPPATQSALEGFVRAGGGLVALHAAPICFDDWPGWRDVLGGVWRWGVSWHPPRARVDARVTRTDHAVLAGVRSPLTVRDEVYGDLDVRDDVDVLVTAPRRADDADQPVVWAHRCGDGRVVWDGFGHDAASIRSPDHAVLLRNAVGWVAGARR
jgi:hypothetical protein